MLLAPKEGCDFIDLKEGCGGQNATRGSYGPGSPRHARSNAYRFRAKREQLKTLYDFPPESQGQNLALTLLSVPHLLDSALSQSICPHRSGEKGPFPRQS